MVFVTGALMPRNSANLPMTSETRNSYTLPIGLGPNQIVSLDRLINDSFSG